MSRLKALREAVFGSPKEISTVKSTRVAVLGAVEQTIGIYQIPSFKDQVDCFWKDPVLKEGILSFAEEVISTGPFLTGNPKYTLVLNGKTALDVIRDWCDDNDIDIKLPEIAVELRAFGNSLWRIDSNGFVKIPIEAVWHAVKIADDVPLQVKYNMQLVPIYGAVVIPWEEFIHFRTNVTGYHAPFGQGVIYSLLARPVDSKGNVVPSIYDMRLAMRSSLNEGFRKFSFGNELWSFEGMSNEDFDNASIGENISKMSSTGNRIATNAKGRIQIAVPERTQSYDEFIKQMRDEFFMSLADPSLKLGLEQGFTKATSTTAEKLYKIKVSNARNVIKQRFEDLFKQILDKLGYNGKEAGIKMHFGPQESPEYKIIDIESAVDRRIITRNEARHLLSEYAKWDITGDIEGGDKVDLPTAKPSPIPIAPTGATKLEGMPAVFTVAELADSIANYSYDFSKIYVDPLVPDWMYGPLMVHEQFEIEMIRLGIDPDEAHTMATITERNTVRRAGLDWTMYDSTYKGLLNTIRARRSKGPPDLYNAGKRGNK